MRVEGRRDPGSFQELKGNSNRVHIVVESITLMMGVGSDYRGVIDVDPQNINYRIARKRKLTNQENGTRDFEPEMEFEVFAFIARA